MPLLALSALLISNILDFQGYLDRATGEINLDFDAEFVFTAGPLYKAPPLQVCGMVLLGMQ